MTVLGLSAYAHDAGVALVEDGQPTFVVEEERLNRERKTTAFPREGLRYLRERRGLLLRDIEAVAFPWRGGSFLRTVGKQVLRRLPSALNLLRHAASLNMSVGTALRFRRAGTDLAGAFGSDTPVRVRFVGHHDAHASAAFLLSPFERAAVLVMDGYGDDGSTSIYHGRGDSLRRVSTNEFFDSAGIMYSMMTKYLGFRTILDEGKVMALAATAQTSCVASLPSSSACCRTATTPSMSGSSATIATASFVRSLVPRRLLRAGVRCVASPSPPDDSLVRPLGRSGSCRPGPAWGCRRAFTPVDHLDAVHRLLGEPPGQHAPVTIDGQEQRAGLTAAYPQPGVQRPAPRSQ